MLRGESGGLSNGEHSSGGIIISDTSGNESSKDVKNGSGGLGCGVLLLPLDINIWRAGMVFGGSYGS